MERLRRLTVTQKSRWRLRRLSKEEQGAPSPPDATPDATAAAGSSAVPVQGEGGTAEDETRGIALHLVKSEPAD